ncbi:MAG TPA: SdpI family protein, partial [Gemmatimonadales bacterium]|nr:SdpI family protein [Gemmatimonadales bacterium]
MRKMLPACVVTLALLAFSLWALPQLPDKVATHWGLDGQPDGWSSARFGALLLPGVMVLLSALFAVLPSIDPLKKNYTFHGSVYFLFVNVIVAFMGVVHLLVLGSALGWPVDMRRVLPILIGALFVFIGRLLPRIQPNWFMGIRTPWTLSSEQVWRKTHAVGATCFTAAGVGIMLIGLFAPGGMATKLMLAAILIGAFWPVVYSYLEWR